MIEHNPHIRYFEGDRRGYFAATVTADRLEAELRFVTSVEDPGGSGYTERTFTVEDGSRLVGGARGASRRSDGRCSWL